MDLNGKVSGEQCTPRPRRNNPMLLLLDTRDVRVYVRVALRGALLGTVRLKWRPRHRNDLPSRGLAGRLAPRPTPLGPGLARPPRHSHNSPP